MYDLVSPGDVLSLHEEHVSILMLANGYTQEDLDLRGEYLAHAMGWRIFPKQVSSDLSVLRNITQVSFGEMSGYRPDSLIPILGRRRIGAFSFIGGMAVAPRMEGVFFILYVLDGNPRAYIPIQGNAISGGAMIPEGPADPGRGPEYPFDPDRILADIKANFGII